MLGPLLALVAFASPAVASAEQHAPISIEGDAMLLLPDAIARNGVRGGSGLATDPWRISNWEIVAGPGGAAIRLNGVQGHVLLDNLTLRTSGGDGGTSIVVIGSPNVRIENVTSEGAGTFANLHRSRVTINDVVMAHEGPHACIAAGDSTLRVRSLRSEGPCGPHVLDMGASDFHGRDIHLERVATGIRWAGAGGNAFDLVNATVTAAEAGSIRGAPDVAAGERGVEFLTRPGDVVRLSQSDVSGFRSACIHVTGEGRGGVVALDSLDLHGCGDDVPHAAIDVFERPGGTVTVTNVTMRGNAVGVHAFDADVLVSRSTIEGSRIGVHLENVPGAPRPTRVVLSQTTLHGNERHVEAEAPGRVELRASWWPEACAPGASLCPTFQGDVIADEKAIEPPVKPLGDPRRAIPASVALVVALLGLLAVLRTPK